MGGPRGRLISASDRIKALELINEAVHSGARLSPCCDEVGISVRTYERWSLTPESTEDKRPLVCRKPPKNKLSDEERAKIIQVINSNDYADLVPAQIVPKLADQGIYIASESTIHRILREEKQNTHRFKPKAPVKRVAPTHIATAQNQVWTWDITWLDGSVKGLYFKLYLILDMFSRMIVGYEVWETENAEYAKILVSRALLSQKILGKPLILHSDNGSPMKAATFLATLEKLGVQSSFSRPRVSNDNPYSESLFKTMKYVPTFPNGGFASISDARKWVTKFVYWYNNVHMHSGIKYLTPYQRHYSLDKNIMENRKKVYAMAKEKHPERWSREIRNWDLPKYVSLNPIKEEELLIIEESSS
ncbi:IS3 family transposase [Clostridium frigoris]|uniref:IS3 family transposase n=1 Tax=Clostridium frigoris TaxID=205327 RepID=A0ABS6BZ01_9CLOT|nr:IS3 family transposase [Clostridium frigoris]MBU3161842.1 IS3 family transposase [Clostridium frigoris]